MAFKFEQLEVWHQALAYIDRIYGISAMLPQSEDFNLSSQIRRAATSIALNVAEGSTGQSNAEQARFLGLAIRSCIETVACIQLIRRRRFLGDESRLDAAYEDAHKLAARLQAFRRSLTPHQISARETTGSYLSNDSAVDQSDIADS